MFDSDSDHTVPSSSVMVYRPSFYPLKESRERRMKTQQYISPNTTYAYQPTKLDGYCVPHQLSCNMSSYGYNENTDNFSGYNIPLEPETPEDDVCVEEILVGLGDASDGWYRPNYERTLSLPPRKRFSDMRVPSQDDDISPPASPFQGRISQIVQQDSVNMMKRRKLSPPQSPEDEPRLVESGDEREHPSRYVIYGFDDEIELEPKRKIKKARLIKKEVAGTVPNAVEVSSTNDEEGGLCGKTNKPRQRKEYFYSKNSKTIFRWTCCGSQAKDHPDF